MAMTPRERFLTALRGGVPDRVPVAPDISNYIPARRTGLPFWEIYFERKIPLWRAYLDAADHYGIDPWIGSCCGAPFRWSDTGCEHAGETVYDEAQDAMVRTTTTRTPEGDLVSRSLCFRADPPSPVEKPIKDLARDWPAYRATMGEPTGIDKAALEEIRRECRARDCAFGVCVGYPGFQGWSGQVEGGVEQLAFATIDHPAILDEWHERDLAAGTRAVELLLQTDVDYLTLGGSGTITLASPELARRYALPAIRRWSAMCKAAGVATVLHSCGKSRVLVDMLAE